MAEAKDTPVQMYDPNNFQLVQHARRDWHYTADKQVALADIERAEFWALIARNGPAMNDIIEVSWEDGSQYARFMVRAVSSQGVALSRLEHHDFGNVANEILPAAFYVQNRGAKAKWCIVRAEDKRIVKGEFNTEIEAEQALVEYEKAVT